MAFILGLKPAGRYLSEKPEARSVAAKVALANALTALTISAFRSKGPMWPLGASVTS